VIRRSGSPTHAHLRHACVLACALALTAACSNSDNLPSPSSLKSENTTPGTSNTPTPNATTCHVTIAEEQRTRAVAAGTIEFDVPFTAADSCAWNAEVSTDFVTLAETSGTGSGVLTVRVAANTGAKRQATVTIGSASVTIEQAEAVTGAPTPPPPTPQACTTVTVTPPSLTTGAAGGPVMFAVTVPDGCTWKAQTTSTFVSGFVGAGTGNGTITFTLRENASTTPRDIIVSVADKTVTVSQAAAPFVAPSPPAGATSYLTLRGDANDLATQGRAVVISGPGVAFQAKAVKAGPMVLSPNLIPVTIITPNGGNYSLVFQAASLSPGVYEGARVLGQALPTDVALEVLSSGAGSSCVPAVGRFEIFELTLSALRLERFRVGFERQCTTTGSRVIGEFAYTAPPLPGPIVPPSPPSGASTYLTFTGEAGDLRVSGVTRTDVPPGTFTAVVGRGYFGVDRSNITITVVGSDGYRTTLAFNAAPGDALRVASYDVATDWISGGGAELPSFMFTPPPGICASTARFQIDELTWGANNDIARLKIKFERQCSNVLPPVPKVVGEISLTAPF